MKPYAWVRLRSRLFVSFGCCWQLSSLWGFGTGDYVTAVVQSTFAAFIGMLASYGVLFFYLWKEGKLKESFGKQAVHPDINPTAIVIETFKEAIPFIITGSAVQLFPVDWPMDLHPYYGEVYKLIVTVSFRFSMLICLQTQVRLLWFWLPLLFLLLGLGFPLNGKYG